MASSKGMNAKIEHKPKMRVPSNTRVRKGGSIERFTSAERKVPSAKAGIS